MAEKVENMFIATGIPAKWSQTIGKSRNKDLHVICHLVLWSRDFIETATKNNEEIRTMTIKVSSTPLLLVR